MYVVVIHPDRPETWHSADRDAADGHDHDAGRVRLRPGRQGRVRDMVIGIALFLLACWQFFSAIDARPFHRDEARWIHRAGYVGELANPFSSYWDEAIWIDRGGSLDEQYRLRSQPPLGSYLMGIGLLAQGRDVQTNGFWIMDQDEQWNVAQGNMPTPADLTAARLTVAVVSALTIAVVYAIGTCLTNRVGGVAAALFLCFHPLVNLYAAFAGSDMLLVFLVALSAMAAYRLADRPSWPRAVLLGVLLGLGGAAKLSPLGVTFPLALLGGLIILRRVLDSRTSWGLTRRLPVAYGAQLSTVPIVAFATFVACYPYLWRGPIDHTLAMFEFRTSGMDLQAAIWPHVAVETRVEAIRRVGARLGDEFTVLGRLGTELEQQFGVSWDANGLELGVAAAGLIVFLALVLRRGLVSAHGLVMVVLGGQAAITIIGMDVDWARYHLPILLFVAVCVGIAAGQGWSLIVATIQQRHQPTCRGGLERASYSR